MLTPARILGMVLAATLLSGCGLRAVWSDVPAPPPVITPAPDPPDERTLHPYTGELAADTACTTVSKDRPPPAAGRRQRRWRRHLPAGCCGAVQREVVDGGRPHGRRPLRRHQAQRRAHVRLLRDQPVHQCRGEVPRRRLHLERRGRDAFRGRGAGLPEEAARTEGAGEEATQARVPCRHLQREAGAGSHLPQGLRHAAAATSSRSARSVERSPIRAARWCAPTASGGRWPSRPR